MIAYTMVGVADLEQARRFYDPLMAEMGLESCWRDATTTSWGREKEPWIPRFFAGLPFDGRPAGVGNGAMTAFQLPSAERVQRLHAVALERGGSCEGAPGLRPQYSPTFYAAYVRDPDGNKLAFVCYDARPA